LSSNPSSCLVQIRHEPDGQLSARVVGAPDLQATAATGAEAVEQLRALLRQQFDSGSLLWVEIARENPLMRWFGHAQDDPSFEEYLEEIRKYREEMDRPENPGADPGECPDTSGTPTT
jgi:hypothetical protein